MVPQTGCQGGDNHHVAPRVRLFLGAPIQALRPQGGCRALARHGRLLPAEGLPFQLKEDGGEGGQHFRVVDAHRMYPSLRSFGEDVADDGVEQVA